MLNGEGQFARPSWGNTQNNIGVLFCVLQPENSTVIPTGRAIRQWLVVIRFECVECNIAFVQR